MSESNLVYLVDDDHVMLDFVQTVLSEHDYSIRCFANDWEFFEGADPRSPACLISGTHQSPVSTTDLLSRLKDLESPVSAILATDTTDVSLAVALMELGAFTLLQKPYDRSKLLDSVQRASAASEQRWLKMQVEQSLRERLHSLSEEELSVMKLMLTGAPIKSIPWRLQLSERTIDRRRQSILKKMQVGSLLELALLLARVDLELRATR